MSNEQQVVQALSETLSSGSRCDQCTHCNREDHVGQPSAGKEIKSRWQREGKGKSLRQFARGLIAAGDKTAQDWFDQKKGALNEKRTDKNQARINLEKQASKSARKKTKSGGKSAATPASV